MVQFILIHGRIDHLLRIMLDVVPPYLRSRGNEFGSPLYFGDRDGTLLFYLLRHELFMLVEKLGEIQKGIQRTFSHQVKSKVH